MTSIRIGIVGAGTISATMHVPVLRAIPSIEIAWITDNNSRRSEALAAANSIRAVSVGDDLTRLPDCDVALLAIPLLSRGSYFEHFANLKVSVMAEKPLSIASDEHRRIVGLFEPWQLAVGYQRRQYATARALRGIIEARLFGRLREVRMAEGARTTRSGPSGGYQDESVARGGGIVKNLGCHSLDLALWLTGATEYLVIDREVTWDGDTDRRATCTVQLTRSGPSSELDCQLVWTVSWLDHQPNTMEFEFDNAILCCNVKPDSKISLKSASLSTPIELETINTGGAVTATQAFYLEWMDFLNSMSQQTESSQSGRSTILVADLMDEILARAG
ncbi:Gfo/Idh/MocA family oxidoreductase [Mesorhizobium sp. M1163]|uniref:Gfo/Idh/MocA family protein n=1 Tax=Mesorhizobium sp. M1163 TaxID=2957065 RepID=UPI00333B199E